MSMALCMCTEPPFHLHYRNNCLRGLPDCGLAHLLYHRQCDPSKAQISPLHSSQTTPSLPPQFSIAYQGTSDAVAWRSRTPWCSLWVALSPCCFFPCFLCQHSWLSTGSMLFFTARPLLTHPLCPHPPSALLSFGLYEPMHFWSKLVHFGFPCNQKSFCAPAHLVRVPASALLRCFVLEFNSLSSPVSSLRARTLFYLSLHS